MNSAKSVQPIRSVKLFGIVFNRYTDCNNAKEKNQRKIDFLNKHNKFGTMKAFSGSIRGHFLRSLNGYELHSMKSIVWTL